jgi:methanogenic corrinoid protein MtbC1
MDKSSEQLKQKFHEALKNLDKPSAINLVIKALEGGSITIIDLYTEILGPSLGAISSNEFNQEISIWEEHIQSGIVRTALEISYPYVLAQRPQSGKGTLSAIVFCLEEEYHELGARMTTDFLTLLGFDAHFIGANTPKKEALDSIEKLNPNLICISVTNYFHLTRLKDLIALMRSDLKNSQTKIVVGGYAIDHTPHAKDEIETDFFAHSFDDLKAIKEALS